MLPLPFFFFSLPRQVTSSHEYECAMSEVKTFFLPHFSAFPPLKSEWSGVFQSGPGVDTTRYYSPCGFLLQRQCAGPLRAAWPVAREQSYLFILPQTKALSCKFSVTRRKPMLKIFIFAKSSAFICSCDAC